MSLAQRIGHGLAVLLLAGAAQAAQEAPYLRVADEHILPAYRALADHTSALQREAVAFCQAPAAEPLHALRQGFHAALDYWQAIEHVRFGPVEFQQRRYRFALWPDKRGAVGKHLAQLLEKRDTTALAPDPFARTSIAVQGFSALERLLFEPEAEPARFADSESGRYRCAVLQAITRNLAQMAGDIVEEWLRGEHPYRDQLVTAAAGNLVFEGALAADARLLGDLHTALQAVLEQKLALPLGASAAEAQPKRAESWRSARSLRNVRLNLAACEALHRVAFASRLGDDALRGRVADAFARALAALDAVGMPLEDAVSQPAGRARLEAARDVVAELAVLAATAMPEALGVTLGFNSLDGD
jgi:predicted lipoprotein